MRFKSHTPVNPTLRPFTTRLSSRRPGFFKWLHPWEPNIHIHIVSGYSTSNYIYNDIWIVTLWKMITTWLKHVNIFSSVSCIKCEGPVAVVKAACLARGGGGGHFHTWEYWGCSAGQGAFLSFQLWHRVSFLSFRNWDRVLFWASNSGHPLSMYFANFSGPFGSQRSRVRTPLWPSNFKETKIPRSLVKI